MSNWIPTNELRFVQREVVQTPVWDESTGTHIKSKTVRILQQKWQANVYDYEANDYVHEWRDVPVVEEEV